MALLDFLKKKEFEKIQQLESEITLCKEKIANLQKYEGIVDVDLEIKKRLLELEQTQKRYNEAVQNAELRIKELERKYNNAHEVYADLKKQIDLYSESLDLAEYGVYEPHFDFDSSEKYKEKIIEVRESQKVLIKDERAVTGGETITWNNSLSKGQAMVKREKKLMLRAFNGECDSFISTVEWNNVQRMVERISKSFDAINKVYGDQGIYIASSYKDLKIKELTLVYEHKLKKYEEKEEQRAIREQMREEEKVQREIEAATLKAEKEEVAYQKALEKARKEMEEAVGEKHDKLMSQIQELEARLKEAECNKERALSMAQQTRRGFVYVISNIGSFGENVYKIGMTRRLEPMDRVRELGDASVPFYFDVHALIFSDNAPSLENALHKAFSNRRVNLVNERREFFNVSLDEIEKVVVENHGEIEFTKIAEAEQYRESLAIRERLLAKSIDEDDIFPEKLFA